jgi:hypothetical protein
VQFLKRLDLAKFWADICHRARHRALCPYEVRNEPEPLHKDNQGIEPLLQPDLALGNSYPHHRFKKHCTAAISPRLPEVQL